MIRKLFETHIHVLNLERSMEFYANTLGLELGALDQSRRAAFYWVGGQNVSMLGLWERLSGELALQHLAFEVSEKDFAQTIQQLAVSGVAMHNFLNTDDKCPTVFGWMPAVSIYFPDPDGHELEILTTLPDKPRPDVGAVSWEVWKNINRSDP